MDKSDNQSNSSIGDRVVHDKFGSGTVIDHISMNSAVMLKIDFKTVGMKILDPRFANLRTEYSPQSTPDSDVDESWKHALSPMLLEITGCEVLPHSRCEQNAISVVLDGTEYTDSSIVSLDKVLRGQPGEFLKMIRSKLPSGFVSFITTMQVPAVLKNKDSIQGLTPLEFMQVLRGDSEPLKKRIGRIENTNAEIEIVVGPGNTQFDILRLARTASRNTRQSTDDMINTLQRFDQELGIDILYAASDALTFEFSKLPKDTLQFAKELFEFCPDFDTQETVDSLAVRLQNSRHVHLWWD